MKLIPLIMIALAVAAYFANRSKNKSDSMLMDTNLQEIDLEVYGGQQSALHDSNWRVRAAAVKAAAVSGDVKLIPDLLSALSDPDYDVREAAKEALVTFGTLATSALVKTLGANDLSTRILAAEALGAIGDTLAIDALVEALGDASMWVRCAVVEALAVIGGEAAITALIGTLSDSDKDVRDKAAAALIELGVSETLVNAKNLLLAEDDARSTEIFANNYSRFSA